MPNLSSVNIFQHIIYERISSDSRVTAIVKEAFRKMLHMLSSLTPLFAYIFTPTITIKLILLVLFIYVISEILRCSGKRVPFISSIVEFANRKNEEKRFSFGPITLAIGIILSLYFFSLNIATISIFSVGFGDGAASLAGKIFGRRSLFIRGKTFEGSLACFCATFVSVLLFTQRFFLSIFVATLTTVIEALPLKDADNIAIPFVVGMATSWLLK